MILYKVFIVWVVIMVSIVVVANEPPTDLNKKSYSPYADQNYPINVYFGDTHLHTNLSVDANRSGNRNLTPAEAYRFARGDLVRAHNGMKVQLRRPLDFLVVADHAINMGVMAGLRSEDPILLKTESGKRLYGLFQAILKNTDIAAREKDTVDFEQVAGYRECQRRHVSTIDLGGHNSLCRRI